MKYLKIYAFITLIACLAQGCSSSDEEQESYLIVNETELEFEFGGGSKSFSIESNAAWTIVPSDDWISVTPSRGNGNQQVMVSVADQLNPVQVKGTLTIRTDDGVKVVNLSIQLNGVFANYPNENEKVLRTTNISNFLFFAGKAHEEDSLVVASNIIWEIKGPEWIEAWDGERWRPLSKEVGAVYGMGAKTVPIRTAARYDGEDLQSGEISLSERITGNCTYKILAYQTGKYGVLPNKVVALSDGIGMNWKFGDGVKKVYFYVTDKTINYSLLTSSDVKSEWRTAIPGSGVAWSGLKENTTYTIAMTSEESLNTGVPKFFLYSAKTPSATNQPLALADNIFLIDNMWYANITMNEYVNSYVVLADKEDGYWVTFSNPLIALYIETLILNNPNYFTQWYTSGYVPLIANDSSLSEVHCATWAIGNDGFFSGVLKHYKKTLKGNRLLKVPEKANEELRDVATEEELNALKASIRIVRR